MVPHVVGLHDQDAQRDAGGRKPAAGAMPIITRLSAAEFGLMDATFKGRLRQGARAK